MTQYVAGDRLPAALQEVVKRRFMHRFTMEHQPAWAREAAPNGKFYAPQYLSDREWLANTLFAVTERGLLDERVEYCESRSATWPLGQWLDRPYQPLRSAA